MPDKKTIDRSYKFSTTGLFVFCGAFALVGAFFLWQAFAATTCLVSNRTTWSDGVVDCTVNSTITRTNATFACNQPLSSYGTLPLKVVVISTGAWDAPGAVTLDNGCVGDNNPDTIDLVVDIQGNGPSTNVGNGHDSFKTRQSPGPRDIQVTGRMECGRQAPAAHQDMMQFQGGTNITIVNATSGNYSAGMSTCQGAGGVIFSSAVNNLDILGGAFMGCNHGILGGSPSSNPGGEVRDTKFRSGRTDGSDPNCANFNASPPCSTDLPMTNVTCGRWSGGRWIDEVINPSNNPPPPPPPPAPTLSLSANPTSVSSGGSTTLTWTSNNATSCTASGAWSGSRATSGTQSVSPTQTSVYNLSCTGSGGTANASVTVTVTTATDTTPPTINITAPANNTTVTANVTVSAAAQDNVGVRGVQFRLDGQNLGNEDTTAPYSVTWDTTVNPNAVHTLTAVARDGAGNSTTSTPITVTINNPPPADTTPPSVSISSPSDGSTVSGTVAVSATASDNNGVARVEFLVDGTLRGTDTTSPYNYSWNTTSFTNGNHSLTARAYDSAGNSASDQHTLNVNNGDTTAPTAPTSLRATAPAYNRVSLSWTASTDNVAVAGYHIVRNGVTTATVDHNPTTGNQTYQDTTVSGSTAYTYQVVAYDARGNNSPASNTSSVTTPAAPDTIPPSAPTGLVAAAVSSSQINLSWRASTDNTVVASYDIYRSTPGSAATRIATVTTTSFGNTGLSPSTAYTYYAVARDAAGNLSAPSGTATATTAAQSPVPGAGVGTLSGRITNSQGSAIAGAHVNITVNGNIQYHTASSTGSYLIQRLPAGSHSTKYKASGYQHQYITNVINAGQNTVRNVTLQAR